MRGSLGDKVDHPAQRGRSVERGGRSLHHLHLFEVGRRQLQNIESAPRRAVQRQAVGEEERVAWSQPLQTHARGAACGRGALHAHPAHLGEEPRHVGGAHLRLFRDVLAGERLHTKRSLLDSRCATRARDHHARHRCRDVGESEGDQGVAAVGKNEPQRVGGVPQSEDGHRYGAHGQPELGDPDCVGQRSRRSHAYAGVGEGGPVGLDADGEYDAPRVRLRVRGRGDECEVQ